MQRRPATQMAQRIKHKHRNICVKCRAIVSHAMVLAVHRACRRAQAAAAGVFEALAGRKGGLLTDHAWAFDLLRDAIGIVDIPAAGDQLRGDVARVGDRDGIGKAKHPHAGRGLRRQILRADLNSELRSGHTVMLTLCLSNPSRRISNACLCDSKNVGMLFGRLAS